MTNSIHSTPALPAQGDATSRIISLLPSATEALALLVGDSLFDPRGGCPIRLVGRSHECDTPAGAALSRIPILTAQRTSFTSSAQIDRDVRAQLATGQALYTLDVALLRELQPDLIITQDLCQVCSIDLAAVRAAAQTLDPVPRIISFNPETIEAILDDMLVLGQALGLEQRARDLLVQLRGRAATAQDYVNPFADPIPVAFIEWTDPLFVAGHWTPQLIERAGGSHPLNPTRVVAHAGAGAGPIGQSQRRAGKSITVTIDELIASQPEAIIVCPCGLSLEEAWKQTALLAQTPWWKQLPAVRASASRSGHAQSRVAVVDGNHMFSRPGPRVIDALEFVTGWLNHRPELIPANFPWRAWTG